MIETKKIKKFLGSQKPKVFAKRKINFDRIALVMILAIISVGGVIAALNVKTEGNMEATGGVNATNVSAQNITATNLTVTEYALLKKVNATQVTSSVIAINGTINITQTASGVIFRNGRINMTGNSSGWYWQ